MYKIKMSDLEKLSKAAKSFKGNIILIQEETNRVFVTDLEDYFFVPAITSGEKITLKYEKQFDTIVSFFKKQKVDEIEIKYFIPFYADDGVQVIKEILDRVPDYKEFLKLKKEVL